MNVAPLRLLTGLSCLSGCLVDPSAWEARRAELACDPTPWFADEDEDGSGGAALDPGCDPPAGAVAEGGDCDDTDPGVRPGAEEVPADGMDGDCDGAELCFEDADGDGFGLEGTLPGGLACDGQGLAAVSGDCDDGSRAISPGATEITCNSTDDDCDPSTPDVGVETPGDGRDDDCDALEQCFEDLDGDGYGSTVLVPSLDLGCSLDGLAPTSDDCDDEDDVLHPAASEVCNGRDDDCDALVDDDDPSVDPAGQQEVPADADGDGFGDPTDTVLACEGPPGGNRLDCDDADPLASVEQDWFEDTDGDLSGEGAAEAHQCLNPGGGLAPAANGVDCEPDDPAVFPRQLEDCVDNRDQDCDALFDCADPDCAADQACMPPCADLAWAPTSLPETVTGTTLGEGDDHVGSCGGGQGLDFAYWFTPPVSGTVVLDTQGTFYDTVLYVRDACGGAMLACNDDEPITYQLWSAVAVNVTAGVPVLVVVDGFAATHRGPFRLRAQAP